jgi:uncharacterized phiE125 gp8 family phage protein
MGLKLVTAPSSNVVTLDEAKAHLREDSDDFDLQITAFIYAATQFVDGPTGFLGRALIDQTWDYYLDAFPCRHDFSFPVSGRRNFIEIPLPPLIEVLGVFYVDASGNEQQFSASSYIVDDASQPARIILKSSASWPSIAEQANAVRIRFRAGYIDASNSPATPNVPFPIKAAILMYVGDLYQNRENQVVGDSAAKLPWASEQLLRPHRVYLSMA